MDLEIREFTLQVPLVAVKHLCSLCGTSAAEPNSAEKEIRFDHDSLNETVLSVAVSLVNLGALHMLSLLRHRPEKIFGACFLSLLAAHPFVEMDPMRCDGSVNIPC